MPRTWRSCFTMSAVCAGALLATGCGEQSLAPSVDRPTQMAPNVLYRITPTVAQLNAPTTTPAAIWSDQAVVLQYARTDFNWPGAQALARAKNWPGTQRGITYAKSKLRCAGTPQTALGVRAQWVVDWYSDSTTSGAGARDTFMLTVIPLACSRAPKGATAALLIAEIRGKPQFSFARLAFKSSKGGTLEELQPDGTLSQARHGDAIFRSPIELVRQLAPRLGNVADAVLTAQANQSAASTIHPFIDTNSTTQLAKPMAPWFVLSLVSQFEHEVLAYYPWVPRETFKPAPDQNFFSRLLKLIDATWDSLQAKLPEAASQYLVKLLFG